MFNRRFYLGAAGILVLVGMIMISCVPNKTKTPRLGDKRDSVSRDGEGQKNKKVETVTPFSIEMCSFPDLNISFDKTDHYAHIHLGEWTSRMGTKFTGGQEVNCNWEKGYKSQHKTSSILAEMDIYYLYDKNIALVLLEELAMEHVGMYKSCTPENLCTREIIGKSGDGDFYLQKNVYPLDGVDLPSTHLALLARSYETKKVGYFVIDISLEHPELELDSTWAGDMAKSLESCALDILDKK